MMDQPPATAPPAEETAPHTEDKTEAAPATDNTTVPAPETNDAATTEEPPKMSKNALKRLRKQQEWEDGRDDRRKKRKEKRHERRERYREAREAIANDPSSSSSAVPLPAPPSSRRPRPAKSSLVPLALVLDCDFESYMTDKELVSLAGQVVRSYSDNRGARYRAHLWIGGWRGKLRSRFETALQNSHRNWAGVGFHEGDFIGASADATARMAGEGAGEMIEPLQRSRDSPVQWTRDDRDPFPLPDPEPEPKEEHKNIVYLTSESPYTLERLEPNTCYVIGGLVDKNREKGLCYRRAREQGIRTARLPIGKFMVMQSRQVLATNHVVEIMLKWLEFEDWGKAFTAVIPKRKGGTLRIDDEPGEGSANGDEAEEDDESVGPNLAVESADAQTTEAVSADGGESKTEEHVST